MDPVTRQAEAQLSEKRQVLTFRLGDETYGIDILRVKEIRGWSPVTRMPHSTEHVLGVMNLRGSIVPVMDLRRRFELASAAFTPVTVVIVVAISTSTGVRECGLVVDAVSDVVDLAEDMLRPAPHFTGSSSADYMEGLAAIGERMLILLSAEALVREEMEAAARYTEIAA